jgi:hypothetical protein
MAVAGAQRQGLLPAHSRRAFAVIGFGGEMIWMSMLFASGYTELEGFASGTVSGTIVLSEPPALTPPRSVGVDRPVCGQEQQSERFILGEGKALANVVVFIKKVSQGKKVAVRERTLNNKGCRFEPHVSAFPQGTRLMLRNSDEVLHNVHAFLGGHTLFNLALPLQGAQVAKEIKKTGVVEFRCDAGHGWMQAWAFVTPHPYAVVTGMDGRFLLDAVPVGSHVLMGWHEAIGEREIGRIDVAENATVTVEGRL